MARAASPLLDPLDAPTKIIILDALWGPISIQGHQVRNSHTFEAYWAFYHRSCEHALYDGGRHVLARTHEDIVDLAHLLQEGRSRDIIRGVLRLKLTKAHDNEDELVDRAIDLAANLLLMVDFDSIEYGFSGRQQIAWSTGSLGDCVASFFGSAPVLGHESVKLHRVFNALNLGRIAGVEIVPTTNLLDHLRLTDDDTKLYIFHHASFLKHQSQSTILPKGLIEETLRTLALLFPQSDPAVRKWYRSLPTPFTLDPQLMLCGHLKTDDRQIETFVYWHDRIVVLKQVFDEATPRTLSQWWHDRRNGVQWYTFWIAIVVLGFTLFFGLIQSIEGALQVYGTFYGEKGS
ncbi:hypothetical protein P153DRAFT_388669 [Dothidotthia symphoricarpi CBS 119687]|uniref:Uncharacterized protein n=1 Tax=Dothidotthia symphoricarpi CBS 119687 TaxID=1392245 RepID=A0A6A6A520_9PLEO|nr:uncharacterized protein P153DRAFT_388669 [Dothidotthia symphoricarpi CBS 119687]KAF2126636.1 hypothetical protein P153DRAFT_388669 [Dothidotthia symphoricarpi CBS 119687]